MQRSIRCLVGLLLVVLAVVGCTSTPPDASPSTAPPTAPDASSSTGPRATPEPGRVAVVVSPEPAATASATAVGTRAAAGRLLGDTELRVVTADAPSFVTDLTSFFAADGYDLVCAVGPGAEEAVREVAPTSPSTRFCAAPARPDDMPANVLPIELRVEEVGYLAGLAMAADGGEGAAALVASRTTWAPRRMQAGLRAGLGAGGRADPEVRRVGPVADEDAVAEAVPPLLEGGVGGVLSWTGELDAAVRAQLEATPVVTPTPPTPSPTATDAASPPPPAPSPSPSPSPPPDRFAALVAGPEARAEGEPPADLVLAIVETHLEQAVALAVGRHLDGWDPEPVSVGLSDGAFRVSVGPSDRASAVAPAIGDAVAALRAGELEVPSG
jgi:hypothetical protein